jgi:chitin disaccharide deacetylase
VLRSLVINADDLGLTIGVNTGIFDAHDHGIVTSASVFANAAATTDAIRRVRSRPSLGVGVHLTLVDGTPTLPPTHVPSLVQDDGRFRTSWKPFIVACLLGQVSWDEVEWELTAQISRIRSEGIRLTHLDSHQHVHAYPRLFAIVARLADRFRIPVLRMPYERWAPVWGDEWQRYVARRQSWTNAALWPWAHRDTRIAVARGLRTPHFIGRTHTGVLNADALIASIRRLRPGVTELMVHPGYPDDALRQMPTRLLSSRATEVALLRAGRIRDALVEHHIQLVRHDLIPVHPLIESFRDAS